MNVYGKMRPIPAVSVTSVKVSQGVFVTDNLVLFKQQMIVFLVESKTRNNNQQNKVRTFQTIVDLLFKHAINSKILILLFTHKLYLWLY